MPPRALRLVVAKGPLQFHVLQAILAHPQLGLLAVLIRVRREVPRVNLVLANLDFVNVLDFGNGLVFFLQSCSGGVHLSVGFLHMVDLIMAPLLVAGDLAVIAINDVGESDGQVSLLALKIFHLGIQSNL